MSNLIKTRIYLDGFNFYYGCVKNTPYKWLDIPQFIRLTLGEQYDIDKVLYFTARVRSFTPTDNAPERQDIYFRALRAMHPGLFEFHYGHFLTNNKWMRRADNPKELIEVINTEEKGSDVNLAVHYLNDAWQDNFDCGIIVSNDSDMAEALKLTKEKFPHKKRGVIFPIDMDKQRELPKSDRKRVSKQLKRYVNANMVRTIRESTLKQSQLPDKIPDSNIYKPKDW